MKSGNKLCDECEKQRRKTLKVRMLDTRQVTQIIYKLMDGNLNNREIGDKFGVDSSTISRINIGNTRKNITQPYAYLGYPLRRHEYTLQGRIEMEIDSGLSGLDILAKYQDFYGYNPVCKLYELITNTKIL